MAVHGLYTRVKDRMNRDRTFMLAVHSLYVYGCSQPICIYVERVAIRVAYLWSDYK
jgi:uncharacterized membrane protein